eukprot:9770055-Karenia_brevis.AAC.1
MTKVQKKIIRLTVGWQRAEGESWESAMRRMKLKLSRATCAPKEMSNPVRSGDMIDSLNVEELKRKNQNLEGVVAMGYNTEFSRKPSQPNSTNNDDGTVIITL